MYASIVTCVMLCKEKHQENQISRFPKWYNILFYTKTKNKANELYKCSKRI